MTQDPYLSLQIEGDGDARVVRCSGKLTSSSSGQLSADVKPLIPHLKTLVLDLSDVSFMDSMGLGTVASLYVSAKTAGCRFEVINLSRRVRNLFTMTHLLSLFEPCGESNVMIP